MIAVDANALHLSRGQSSYLLVQVSHCDPSGNPPANLGFRSMCPPSLSPTTESRDAGQARAWTAVLCLDLAAIRISRSLGIFTNLFASLLLRRLPMTVRTFVLFQIGGSM